MLIEKFGEDLKIANQSLNQAVSDRATLDSLDINLQQNQEIVEDLVYLNTSFQTSESNYNQLVADYNTLYDKVTCFYHVASDIFYDFSLPQNVIHEIPGTYVAYNKSPAGNDLILSLGLSIRDTQTVNYREICELFYDMGSGWVSLGRTFYTITGMAQFFQLDVIFTSITPGPSTFKLGIENRSGTSTRLLNYNMVLREFF